MQGDVSAGGSRRAEVCSGNDAVRDDPVCAAVERLSRRHGDDRAACTPHLRAHGAQEILQVADLWLTGGVADDGVARRAAGGQHGVLRRAHTGGGQHDLAARQPSALTVQLAAVFLDGRAQGAQCRQVQVNGPRPKLAPAGITQLRPAAPGQDRPQEDHR